MLVAVLGWTTIAATVLMALVTLWALDMANRRPWRFRDRVQVPRETRHVEWEVMDPMQDNPIPWI